MKEAGIRQVLLAFACAHLCDLQQRGGNCKEMNEWTHAHATNGRGAHQAFTPGLVCAVRPPLCGSVFCSGSRQEMARESGSTHSRLQKKKSHKELTIHACVPK
eukprot:1161537-Pelagomonas_calceolata.AAC.5